MGWREKPGLFSKSYKLISISFNVLSSCLHIAAFEFSTVQSSAPAHQLTSCSAGLPFSISHH
jgi:hypothetical protein